MAFGPRLWRDAPPLLPDGYASLGQQVASGSPTRGLGRVWGHRLIQWLAHGRFPVMIPLVVL